MEELNISFQKYMDEFKKISTIEKRNEIIGSIKELIAIFEQIAKKDNIELHYIKNNEIKDLKQDQVSEDDFLEAELVYLEVAKNMIGEYILTIINILYTFLNY